MKPQQPDGKAGSFSVSEGGAPAIRIFDQRGGRLVVVGATPLLQEVPFVLATILTGVTPHRQTQETRDAKSGRDRRPHSLSRRARDAPPVNSN